MFNIFYMKSDVLHVLVYFYFLKLICVHVCVPCHHVEIRRQPVSVSPRDQTQVTRLKNL